MSGKTNIRSAAREARQDRIRFHVQGTSERPRLCVFRSNKHIYVQVIDDSCGNTLAAASTLSPDYRQAHGQKPAKEAAALVGGLIAARCLEKGIKKVVFDRNGFIFKQGGTLAILAEGARKGGLDF